MLFDIFQQFALYLNNLAHARLVIYNFFYYMYNLFKKKMKKDHDEDSEEISAARIQSLIRVLIQQSSADRIYWQLHGNEILLLREI